MNYLSDKNCAKKMITNKKYIAFLLLKIKKPVHFIEQVLIEFTPNSI